MTNEEKILEMLAGMQAQMNGMQGELKAMNRRLDSVEEKLDALAEEHAITREGVNKLVEWSENAGYIIHYPFGQVK